MIKTEGSQQTRCRADGIAETVVKGHVTSDLARSLGHEFVRLNGIRLWLFMAHEVTSYDPAAVNVAIVVFRRARSMGLETIVVVTQSRVVRLGASLVRMAGKLDIRVVATQAEAERLLLDLKRAVAVV